MSSQSAKANLYRALSIVPLDAENAAPVLYELVGDSTEIGAADDNAIVLSDRSVAPRHLAVRRADDRDYLLIDLAERWRHRDREWVNHRPGDTYWCPRHGSFARLDERGWCAQCPRRRGSLWLMRSLGSGDSFCIGKAFRATYIVQEREATTASSAEAASPFPPNEIFETRTPPRISLPASETEIRTSALPTDDSNLWRWQPEGVPFPIFLHQRVNVAITRHARQNSDREVGGVLLGEVRRDENGGLYVIVTHALQAEFADETRGHLTFTKETWLKIHHLRESLCPDKIIVGWYHTHPGWTIFLSQWDLFIHQNFFKQPWQIALVIDPSLDRAGFFVWDNGEVNNPHAPMQPFRLAELESLADVSKPRVRIRLTDVRA